MPDRSTRCSSSRRARNGGPRRCAVAAALPQAAWRAAARGSRRRRRAPPKHPLIEIARAREKEDALAGLERWKARHPEAAAHLQPADVLVDAMRGRFITLDADSREPSARARDLRPGAGGARSRRRLNDWSGVSDAWPRAEDLLELVRSRDLELIVGAVVRRLVGAPALETAAWRNAVALHVVVLHFADALDAQRLPRQILARAPAALAARHARRRRLARCRPLAPGMIVERVSAAAARAPSTSCLRMSIVNADVTPT